MGGSISFICNHCRYQENIHTGVGYAFPYVYKEVVNDIKEGKFGEKWRDLFLNTPHAVVNANLEAYYCPSCGKWMSDYNLSLYVPIDSDEQDITEVALPDYVCPWELPHEWKMLRLYIHKCPDCGKRMRYARWDDLPLCPQCGQRGTFGSGTVLWD